MCVCVCVCPVFVFPRPQPRPQRRRRLRPQRLTPTCQAAGVHSCSCRDASCVPLPPVHWSAFPRKEGDDCERQWRRPLPLLLAVDSVHLDSREWQFSIVPTAGSSAAPAEQGTASYSPGGRVHGARTKAGTTYTQVPVRPRPLGLGLPRCRAGRQVLRRSRTPVAAALHRTSPSHTGLHASSREALVYSQAQPRNYAAQEGTKV